MTKIPLLSQIFERQPCDPPLITLANLSTSLNVPIDRLEPLCAYGWLKLKQGSVGKITSQSYVEAPTEAALKWLRQWFQPLWDKPMFSIQDMAQLLGVDAKVVLEMAAAHDVPVVYDPGFGHMFSIWSARSLLGKVLSGGRQDSGRFDRQAMIWHLLEGDPRRLSQLPSFDEQLEREIERVAKLDEPARTTRSMDLIEQFHDAKIIVSAERLSSEPSQPDSLAGESSCSANAQLLSTCEQKFSVLL